MIDILNIKPHEVSDDITGYVIGVYSRPGAGKTTLVSKFPNCLILATELGYKAIPGVIAQPINTWSDFLIAVSQLRKPEAKERFRTIAIDTLDELVFLATEYVLQQQGVKDLIDIPYGKGFNILEDTLRKPFRQLVENYGLILLAHDTSKTDEEDKEIRYATLNFNKKVKRIVVGLLDLLIYVEMKRGTEERIMHFHPSEAWEAKTRLPNIVPSAVFSYENLVLEMKKAISTIATTSKREVLPSEGTQFPSTAEFEIFMEDLNMLAMEKIQKLGEAELVKSMISESLSGRKLGLAELQDFYTLKELEKGLQGL